jgi:hypothetical protein
MSLSVFESSLFDSFEKTCTKLGYKITYADRIFHILKDGVIVSKGDMLQTQQFLKSQLSFPRNAHATHANQELSIRDSVQRN